MADTKISKILSTKGWLVGDMPDGRLTPYSELITPDGNVFGVEAIREFISSEYVCEYCTTANAKENTTCSQCGAPRSFVIG